MPEKLPQPKVDIDETKIYVHRPWVQKILMGKGSESQTPVPKPKPILTEEQKKERARRIKIMEIERRKALRAARLRMKMRKSGTPMDETLIIPEEVIIHFLFIILSPSFFFLVFKKFAIKIFFCTNQFILAT